MLVEADQAGDQQVAVDRILARAAREAVVGDAFTPDLEVRGESARTTLDEARRPEGRQRLTAVGRRGAAGVTIIEGEGEVGRNGQATAGAGETTLRNGADVHHWVALCVEGRRRARASRRRGDLLVVADQRVVEQDRRGRTGV